MPKGKFPYALLAALLLAAPAVAADPVAEPVVVPQDAPEASQSHEEVVSAYLDWMFRRTDGKRLKEAKKLIPRVVAASLAEDLDPLLVSVVVYCESTWSPKATGKIGEVGLMQVHGMATTGFDVTTIEGNLAAGCAWLASRIRLYGFERGMAAYVGGSLKRAEWRIQKYREAQKRHGRQTEGRILLTS